MTTTVLIGIQGNKAVKIDTPNGSRVLLPNKFVQISIHGLQALSVQETGEFIDGGPATTSFDEGPAAAPMTSG